MYIYIYKYTHIYICITLCVTVCVCVWALFCFISAGLPPWKLVASGDASGCWNFVVFPSDFITCIYLTGLFLFFFFLSLSLSLFLFSFFRFIAFQRISSHFIAFHRILSHFITIHRISIFVFSCSFSVPIVDLYAAGINFNCVVNSVSNGPLSNVMERQFRRGIDARARARGPSVPRAEEGRSAPAGVAISRKRASRS